MRPATDRARMHNSMPCLTAGGCRRPPTTRSPAQETAQSRDSHRGRARAAQVHLFDIDIPGGITFRESDTLAPGGAGTVVDTDAGRLGIGICYDIRFPELAMLYADRGAQLLVYPGAPAPRAPRPGPRVTLTLPHPRPRERQRRKPPAEACRPGTCRACPSRLRARAAVRRCLASAWVCLRPWARWQVVRAAWRLTRAALHGNACRLKARRRVQHDHRACALGAAAARARRGQPALRRHVLARAEPGGQVPGLGPLHRRQPLGAGAALPRAAGLHPAVACPGCQGRGQHAGRGRCSLGHVLCCTCRTAAATRLLHMQGHWWQPDVGELLVPSTIARPARKAREWGVRAACAGAGHDR